MAEPLSIMVSGLVGLLTVCALGTVVWAQQGKEAPNGPVRTPPPARPSVVARPRGSLSQTLRRQYESLIEEYRIADQRSRDEVTKLKTQEEKSAYARANFPVEQKVVKRFLELARAHPEDPVALDSLAWVALLGFRTPESLRDMLRRQLKWSSK
jgi:hypothetical protein